jgi:hypothetical protein
MMSEHEYEAEIVLEETPLEAAYRKGAEEMSAKLVAKFDDGSEYGDWAVDVIE